LSLSSTWVAGPSTRVILVALQPRSHVLGWGHWISSPPGAHTAFGLRQLPLDGCCRPGLHRRVLPGGRPFYLHLNLLLVGGYGRFRKNGLFGFELPGALAGPGQGAGLAEVGVTHADVLDGVAELPLGGGAAADRLAGLVGWFFYFIQVNFSHPWQLL